MHLVLVGGKLGQPAFLPSASCQFFSKKQENNPELPNILLLTNLTVYQGNNHSTSWVYKDAQKLHVFFG